MTLPDRIDAGLEAIEERYADYIRKAGIARHDGDEQLARQYLWKAQGLAEASADIRYHRVPAELRPHLGPVPDRTPLSLLDGGAA